VAFDPYRVARSVGSRVAECRRAYGLTQEKFAEKIEVSVKYLQRLEAGKENLTIHSIVGLANALEVPPSSFWEPGAVEPRRPGRPRSKR
jgi:transcriptional regulator with XRE-family HTH domain